MIYILIIIALIILVICLQKNTENFELTEYTETCNNDIPIISSSCNKVPNFPRDIEHRINIMGYVEEPFERLTPKEGKYTFYIPELKYDGIYSKNDENCSWDLYSSNKEDTYSSNKFLEKENVYDRKIEEHCKGYNDVYPF